MNSGANANSEFSIMPLIIKYSSTAKVAANEIR